MVKAAKKTRKAKNNIEIPTKNKKIPTIICAILFTIFVIQVYKY